MPARRPALASRTKADLLAEARRRGLAGVSSMRKAELLAALQSEDGAKPPASAGSSPRANRPAALTSASSATEDRLSLTSAAPGWWRVEWSLTAATLRRGQKAVGLHRAAVRLLATGGGDPICEEPVGGPGHVWFVRCEAAGPLRASLVLLPTGGGRHFSLAKSRPAASSWRPTGHLPPLPEEVVDEISRLHAGEDFPFHIAATLSLHGRAPAGSKVIAGETPVTADADGQFDVRLPMETGRAVFPLEVRSPGGVLRRTGVASSDFNLRVMQPTDEE